MIVSRVSGYHMQSEDSEERRTVLSLGSVGTLFVEDLGYSVLLWGGAVSSDVHNHYDLDDDDDNVLGSVRI